ncbi:MAG: hypothetical protein ACKPJJ_36855 [Planctomycetaceae bacterium]
MAVYVGGFTFQNYGSGIGKIPWRDVWMLKVSLDTKSEEFTKLLLLAPATKNVVDYRHSPTAAAS